MKKFKKCDGRQKIELAQAKEQEVVTVVLGENGRGKTGIYRAMMLALFGDRKLLQDAQEAEIYLANINAVEESSENGEGIYCTVQLDFEHHGEKDRKSTRLNSSHVANSYAVFCLKKKKNRT